MKLICLSDLHGQIKNINIPEGDILIIAGDVCKGSTVAELDSLNRYLGSLPHRHKIVIAGNHDFSMERLGKWEVAKQLTHATYLEDTGITIDGIHFWGSPWQPEFHDWAFNLPRGHALAEKWRKIPDNTDVLITHSPPYSILDITHQATHSCLWSCS
jgi:3',5'-cyclic AMP phosphodiesterase CpdA